MTSSIEFTSQYKLDKDYYIECYEQSVTTDLSLRPYYKAILFLLIGTGMLLTQLNPYASWFLIGLGVLEALGVKFNKSWWLMRQMISKAANSDVLLTINEQSIKIDSYYVNKEILWNEINKIAVTQKGFLLYHDKTRHYLSNKNLNHDVIKFISNKTVYK
ncbi:YcxB family protein [Shewanella surugensis]|uniref:YcxB family protein n=1 Tax=Shewanella surugensis TaxID=212020 RepID=A0ABT0LHM1_9GAMM|nr:YcxB family protein [Shewanella surugensis]MCL1126850.1 YcxB family protein [Shewanella surugensis]